MKRAMATILSIALAIFFVLTVKAEQNSDDNSNDIISISGVPEYITKDDTPKKIFENLKVKVGNESLKLDLSKLEHSELWIKYPESVDKDQEYTQYSILIGIYYEAHYDEGYDYEHWLDINDNFQEGAEYFFKIDIFADTKDDVGSTIDLVINDTTKYENKTVGANCVASLDWEEDETNESGCNFKVLKYYTALEKAPTPEPTPTPTVTPSTTVTKVETKTSGYDDGSPFTRDTCGNVFDRCGNEIYYVEGCTLNTYKLVPTDTK